MCIQYMYLLLYMFVSYLCKSNICVSDYLVSYIFVAWLVACLVGDAIDYLLQIESAYSNRQKLSNFDRLSMGSFHLD